MATTKARSPPEELELLEDELELEDEELLEDELVLEDEELLEDDELLEEPEVVGSPPQPISAIDAKADTSQRKS